MKKILFSLVAFVSISLNARWRSLDRKTFEIKTTNRRVFSLSGQGMRIAKRAMFWARYNTGPIEYRYLEFDNLKSYGKFVNDYPDLGRRAHVLYTLAD